MKSNIADKFIVAVFNSMEISDLSKNVTIGGKNNKRSNYDGTSTRSESLKEIKPMACQILGWVL